MFSHRSDVDGITPVILSKLVFEEVDYILEEPSTINEKVQEVYEAGNFDLYDFIYVTDLCINHDLAQRIEQDTKNKNKILVFDHHYTKEEMNQYSFITVKDNIDGKKECGSSLFFNYLLSHYANDVLKKLVVSEMVELVRLIDTWEWKKENIVEATWISNLLGIYGREYYIEYYYQFCCKEEHFYFEEKQQYLLEIEELRIKNYIIQKEQEIYSILLKNYHIGVVFAERYRSELGNYLAEKYQDTYDFFMIINVSRSVSYRGIKEIDLGAFAQLYGGSGHKKTAGSSLPKELLENVIQMIFPNADVQNK